jgi:hypothetical protein
VNANTERGTQAGESAEVLEAIALALFRDDKAYFTMYDDASALDDYQRKWDKVWCDVLSYRAEGKPHANGYFAKAEAVLHALGLEQVAIVNSLGFLAWTQEFIETGFTIPMATPIFRLGAIGSSSARVGDTQAGG